ncbi:methyltransferase [Acidobacteria bacterium ACD]|nr:methyltransferase [Acidobacteria bacterium ACD]
MRQPWSVTATFPSLSPWRIRPSLTGGDCKGGYHPALVDRPTPDLDAILGAIGDPELARPFTRRFLDATLLYDTLVDAAAWEILAGVGALPGPGGVDPAEAASRLSLGSVPARVLRYLLAKLADAGHLTADGHRFLPAGGGPGSVAGKAEALRAAVPEAAVGAEIVEILVAEASDFFRGERTGEEILFAPSRVPLWLRYFSNDNVLYAVNNVLGAEALSRVLPASGARVLEVGGGAGSAAEAALRRLGPRVTRYAFTELVPTFLRRGERAARAAASPGTAVDAARLDMTRPWAEQGVEPGRFDAVLSVNCFHVAPDLDFVLAEARKALAPGGAVVLSECVKPADPFRPVYVEFVFGFLTGFSEVQTHPERRPAPGFLSPAAWRASFAAAGLPEVTFLPDAEAVGRLYRDFLVAAVVARA